MSINLTLEQEDFIQTKLQAGKYQTAEEVLETALRLLNFELIKTEPYSPSTIVKAS
ncbi:ribbon-helix-helix domain-containing protein [Phormidium nigroviride]